MTTTTAMRPDMSRALALLAAGHTTHAVAKHIGWPASAVRAAANGQRGWLIDDNGRVYDPSQPGYRVQLPVEVTPADLDWAKQIKADTTATPPTLDRRAPGARPGLRSPQQVIEEAATAPPPAPTPPTAPPPAPQSGDVDQLLARAASVDDRRVQAALRTATTAITALRDRLTVVEQRAAEEAEKAQARAAALDEVAKLETALAAAKARAKQLGARPGQTAPPAAIPSAAGRDPDKWVPGREPTATPARKYTPGTDYPPVDVRAWARQEGYAFPRNGRFLPGPLVQQWIDETGGAS
ncbi:hypothetical protein [Streptosporangium saharense]|uniref:hypothetical protein n=1 Tax=Streptosporangium saharense TaxID=1706840 RepID=UPI0033326D23